MSKYVYVVVYSGKYAREVIRVFTTELAAEVWIDEQTPYYLHQEGRFDIEPVPLNWS
jgi:hypothetical protein